MTAGPPDGARSVPRWPVLAAGCALLAVVTGVLLGVLAPSVASLYGLPTPGTAVEAMLPIARIVAALAAAVVVGHLLVAAVLVPGAPDGLVSPPGYTSLRALRGWSAVQTLACLTVGLLTIVENTGLPVSRLLAIGPALFNGVQQIEPATGWLLTAALAALVGLLAGWVLSWRGAVGLLVLELTVQLPMTLTAATNAQRSHDIAGDAVMLHALGAVVWLGSTFAVVSTIGGATGADDAVLLRRHATIAGWALPVVAASGIISAAYAITPAHLFTSGYGRLVVASVLVLAVLVALARWLRRAGGPRVRPARLLVVELGLLALALALGTGLTRLIPPAQVGYNTSRLVYLIGYDLPPHLSASDLVLRWRPDLVFGSLAVVAAVLYLLGVRRLRRAGTAWPVGESVAWLGGCATLLVATSSGLGTYAPAVFSLHMVQHMLLATVAPTLLVLGHGMSLLVRVSPAGVARRLTSLLGSAPVRLLGHPLLAWIAVGVTLFGLYPTGFYAAILQQHWAHLGMNVVFLGTGLALFWSVLGRSGGATLPPIGQIVMIFALMALHAGFSAWLLSQPTPLAAEFYTALRLPYVPGALADQRLGAVLGWILAEVPVILAVGALVRRWATQDRDNSEGPVPADTAGAHQQIWRRQFLRP
jgi:putative copper resistance protein D